MDSCIFCKIISKEIPANIIDENDSVLVILSLENHPLIITKKHIKDIYEMDDVSGAAVMKEAVKISKAVKKALNCEGVNLVQSNEPAAGQEVFHFHLHIKPRWINDDINLHWVIKPIDVETREETTEKIKKALA